MARPSSKEDAITEALRARIIAGELPSGSKLPTYAQLIEEFSASMMTIHKVISRLKGDGFIAGLERKGVFVAEKPPHLNRIALLLGVPGKENRFMRSMELSAQEFSERGEKEIEVFSCLNGRHFRLEEAKRLKEELAARRFAGMIVAFNPAGCPDQEIFEFPTPKLYFSATFRDGNKNVTMDQRDFIRRGFERLSAQGVRRLAILSYPFNNPVLEIARKSLGDFGFSSKPEWQLGMDNPELAEQITKLLLATPASERPDGILLADDHLVEAAAKGVFASRVRIPDELRTLCHCNWVQPPQRPFPMDLLGFDSAMALKEALDFIDAANAGKPFSGNLLIPALFEDEMLEARSRAAKPREAS